jgi:hypothetical protein
VEIKHGGEPGKGKERDLDQEDRETAGAGEGDGGLEKQEQEQEQENQPDSEITSMPLEEAVEEWWELKMVWCGTTYDLRVGGNDMCVARVPRLTCPSLLLHQLHRHALSGGWLHSVMRVSR